MAYKIRVRYPPRNCSVIRQLSRPPFSMAAMLLTPERET
jgi:hypothetical protein